MLTKHDLAKYPFLSQTAEYIKPLDLKIKDLPESLERVLKHAEERVTASFMPSTQHPPPIRNPDIEIASFPVAIMIVAAINDKYLKKRYALYEAKRIHQHLKQENPERILRIARFFKWDIKNIPATENKPYQSFKLPFTTYLQNTTTFQEPQWKLINRQLSHGKVPLAKQETSRLLQEEIRKHIEAKLNTKVTTLPPEIRSIVERVKNTFTAHKPTIKLEEYPETVDPDAFPPCIKALYNATTSGHHLSHTGRFTLTAFLVNIGMTTENILDLFRTFSDFNERLTRYQVEHIGGQRGSRTKYIPPRCSTLRTHRVCVNPDEICEKVRHPLAYYRRKVEKKEN